MAKPNMAIIEALMEQARAKLGDPELEVVQHGDFYDVPVHRDRFGLTHGTLTWHEGQWKLCHPGESGEYFLCTECGDLSLTGAEGDLESIYYEVVEYAFGD